MEVKWLTGSEDASLPPRLTFDPCDLPAEPRCTWLLMSTHWGDEVSVKCCQDQKVSQFTVFHAEQSFFILICELLTFWLKKQKPIIRFTVKDLPVDDTSKYSSCNNMKSSLKWIQKEFSLCFFIITFSSRSRKLLMCLIKIRTVF